MWVRGGKPVCAAGVIVAVALAIAAPAGAKMLPIGSVSVTPDTPTAGQTITVTVRFQRGKDFVDAGWEHDEISILPAARADARGWPRSSSAFDDRGAAIPIHRVGFGVFRGTTVVRTPGDYVVLDTSGIVARLERSQGVVNISGTYPSPVRVHVVPPAHSSSRSAVALAALGALVALALAAIAATATRRTRRRRGRAVVAAAVS